MKIKLYFDKGNLGRLAVAMIFAAVLFWKIGFSVWALPVSYTHLTLPTTSRV